MTVIRVDAPAVSGGYSPGFEDFQSAYLKSLDSIDALMEATTVEDFTHHLDRLYQVRAGLYDNQKDDLSIAFNPLVSAASRRFVERRQQHQQSDTGRLERGGDFILDQPDTIPAVWGKGDQVLWAEGEGLMLNGHQGVGKTTIAQQLVLKRLGLRDPDLLGLPVQANDRRLLYLAMDRPLQAARSFRRMITEDDKAVLNERLRIWRGPLPINPCTSASALANWMDDKFGTVVIDSVKDLAPGISSDEVGAALNMAWQELIARDVQVLLLHHERKAGGGEKRHHALDDIYGSTWLTSGLGSVVTIAGDPGDPTIELRHLKQPAEPVGPLTARHDHIRGETTLFTGSTDLRDLLVDRGEQGLTAEEAAQLVLGRTTDGDRKRMKRDLNRLVTGNQAVRKAGGHTSEGRQPDRWFASVETMWMVS